jgi:hypothetical protein
VRSGGRSVQKIPCQHSGRKGEFAIQCVTTQHVRCMTILQHWIPAFAGMTSHTMSFSSQSYRQKPARSAIQVELFSDELSSYSIVFTAFCLLSSVICHLSSGFCAARDTGPGCRPGRVPGQRPACRFSPPGPARAGQDPCVGIHPGQCPCP